MLLSHFKTENALDSPRINVQNLRPQIYQSTCFHSIKRLEQALIGSDGRDLFASALLAVLRAVQSLKIEADDLQSSNGA
jgi:hypothetical protein